ncbi:MAG TPA: hypothetical protein VN620_14330, partial [Candidatus Methylomirabilis sp.]|nr:hypothetical protein [Candidatus Methylomirabilis sp.]
RLLAGAGIIVLVTGLGFGAWWYRRNSGAAPPVVERQFTFNAPENHVQAQAISPDGKYIAYNDSVGLHLRVIASGEEHDLPAPTTGRLIAISWFPDGNTLLLGTDEAGFSQSAWTLSIFGGNPSRLRTGAGEPAVSPDGSQIAYLKVRDGNEIWLMDAHGENPRMLLKDNDHILSLPAWSPDGRYVAYLRTDKAKPGGSIEAWDIRRGGATEIVSDPKLSTNALSWNRDWRILYGISGSAELVDTSLWKINVSAADGHPKGTANPIAKFENFVLGDLSTTRDGKTLSVLRAKIYLNVYVGATAQNGARLEAVRRLTSHHSFEQPSAWTADSSSILFSSNRNGTSNIFRQNIQGQTAERVLGSSDADAKGATFTPDGAWILYEVTPKGDSNASAGAVRLMRAPASGGSPDVVLEVAPSVDSGYTCPRHANAICIWSEKTQKEITFYELDPLRGKGKELAKCEIGSRPYYGWDVSPDGHHLAVVSSIGPYVRTIELATGKTRDVPVPGDWLLQSVGWSADGRGLFMTLWTPRGFTLGHVDLAGNAQVLLNKGFDQWMTGPIASPDGRYLAFSAQTWDSNVWLLEDF